MNTTHFNALEAYIEQDSKAVLFFSQQELSPSQIEEYSTNAAVLNAVKKIIAERDAIRIMCGARVTAYWATIVKYVMDIDTEQYPHSLPMNERRFRATLKNYQEFGYAGLIRRHRAQDSKTPAMSI